MRFGRNNLSPFDAARLFYHVCNVKSRTFCPKFCNFPPVFVGCPHILIYRTVSDWPLTNAMLRIAEKWIAHTGVRYLTRNDSVFGTIRGGMGAECFEKYVIARNEATRRSQIRHSDNSVINRKLKPCKNITKKAQKRLDK